MGPDWIASAFALLLDTSWRAAVLTALVGLVLTAARAHSSAVRHRAWCLALVAMLLMPVLSTMAPKFELPVPAAAGRAMRAPDVEVSFPPESQPFPPTRPTTTTGQPSPGLPAASVATPARRVATFRARELAIPALLALYAAGALWGLARLALGWAASLRLVRDARPTGIGDAVESSAVATPVTVGVLRPRIVLPSSWRTWPSGRLAAILAHERAHVGRRDALVAFGARVNRSLFWFNPAAWWIERRLAAEAEHACDEAGVEAIGASREYAEVLVEMADIVRRHGGRVIQPSLGVEGSGLLGQRIDRVLLGRRAAAMPRRRQAMVAFGCLASVAIVVSCTRPTAAPPPLRENAEVARRQAQYHSNEELLRRIDGMQLADLDALEASVKQNPKDVEAWKALKWFYLRRAQALLGWNEMTRRRVPYVAMLIEQLPESPEAVWRVTDPGGYAAAAAAWRARTSASNAPTAVLANAAAFFSTRDFPEAERLLLRVRARGSRLGRPVVAAPGRAVFRSDPRSPFSADGSPTTPFDRDPGAQEVFARVLASTDVEVMATAGSRVISGSIFDPGRAALGRQLVDRALALDPANPQARRVLLAASNNDRMRRLSAKQAELAGLGDKAQRREQLTPEEIARVRARALEAARAMPEPERLWALLEIAEREVMSAEYLESSSTKDASAIAAALEQSKQAVTEGWHWPRRSATARVRSGHVPRKRRTGGARAARRPPRRVDALHARGCRRPGVGPARHRPVARVEHAAGQLPAEERASAPPVVEFVEKSAALRTIERERLLADAAAIRAGEMPASYQYAMARR